MGRRFHGCRIVVRGGVGHLKNLDHLAPGNLDGGSVVRYDKRMTNTMDLAPIFDLADHRNITAGHMIQTYDATDTTLGLAIRAAAGVDVITDSVIDDILTELDGDDA